MKLVTYPKYKPSGVEWLGNVPENWEVKRGRFLMQVNPRTGKAAELDPDDEISFVPMDSVGVLGGLNLDQTKPISEIGAGYTEFQNGDVVVAKITPCFENGKCALAAGLTNGVAFGTTELHVLRTFSTLDSRFLFFLTISSDYRKTGEAEMYGAGGQKRVPPEFNKNFRTPLPPMQEQRKIADFLETRTVKIDALLTKRRALIEKLKEKRTALISSAVTRGLNPNAKLKPSGIEWLGDVAQEWTISPIKFLVSTPVTDGPHETPEIIDYGIPFVSAEAINNHKINFDKIRGHITEEDHKRFCRKYKPQKGDIYMVKSGATTGRLAMVETEIEFNIWSPLAAIRCNPKLLNKYFLFFYLQSKEFQIAVELSWSYGTQQNIGMGVIQNLDVPVPSIAEQIGIAEFLDRETGKIDRMVEKVETAIEKLQEYRTALITAAVTGKIDVRKET